MQYIHDCNHDSFGNETKAGWITFFENVKKEHVSVQIPQRTFITDQGKGLTESIASVFPMSGQLCCSYHRSQNILKFVRGGTGPYSAHWLYWKCMGALTVEHLNKIKYDTAKHVSDKALKYINSLDDAKQFPCARIGTSKDVYTMNRTASSSVEGMNRVNKPARDRTAVDPINSMILLVEMSNAQFVNNGMKAWKCESDLTPYGAKLCKGLSVQVKYTEYYITVDSGVGETISASVTKNGTGNAEHKCFFLSVADDMGSHFGGCSCGRPNVQGVPCHHMIAVVKSSRIINLTTTNIMPNWWRTEVWRKQYPKDIKLSSVTMNTLTSNHVANQNARYCPPYAAPMKTGRPKSGKRSKSPLEGKGKKKKKSLPDMIETESKKVVTKK